ncbi:hypothetical protein ACFOKI_09290 [Sphingomonas qilianensis]|uniref:Uncharacterized protein n=1 Tax=Sphingomonas qilianensis TaxID=1736690 RepID=A0ABU9XSK6_9SPHN
MTSGPELSQSFLPQLVGDVIVAAERLKSHDVAGNRRDLVRTTFAAIEGAIWTMRESVRETTAGVGLLTPMADMALRELTIHVDDKGRVIEQVRFLTLPTVIRLTINQAQLLDETFQPSFGDKGWQDLQIAIKVRHRITHPKTTSDLMIADSDLSAVRSGFSWLLALVEETLLRTLVASKMHVKLGRELLDELKRGDPAALQLYHQKLSEPDPIT